MNKKYRIDGHGHLLPYPKQIPQFMKKKEIFWVSDDRKFMYQKNWQRPITDASFFLKEKIEWLDRNVIDHEVILNLSQLYCNGLSRKLTNDTIRFQNDFNAQVQHENPTYFTCGFVIQPAFVDDALKEIERCVNDLNLNLLCLPTQFLNQKGEWTSVADESVEPIFELANKYKLAVQIHPYDGQKFINLKDRFWRFHLVWMCAQTADVYHLFTLLDYDDKYPDMRTCFAHGNQFGQMNLGRRVQGFEGRPDLFEGAQHPNKALGTSNVFFDTIVHDVYSFRLLIDRQGASQVVAGIDDPYPLGEMDSVGDCYPGRVIDLAVEKGFITEKDKDAIWCSNVLNWLYGDNQKEFWQRVK